MSHPDHDTDSEPPSRLPNPVGRQRQASQLLRLWCDAVGDRTPASRTRADAQPLHMH